MSTLYFDSACDDDQRRSRLYAGDLFVYSPGPGSTALVEFARSLIRDAFGPLDPETAQAGMPVEDYAALLGKLKPLFIHSDESKRCIRQILAEAGCDPDLTYFDVPRLRSATSDNYLSTGIAYAFHPHRDTWYSAPFCQINWWIPVFPVESGNCMAFHPRYWSQPVRNGSAGYNYQEWNRTSRFNAAQHIGTDNRRQPRPEEPVELEPDVRVVTPPGGMLLFSAAHLHSTVPNMTGRTRFSIDFRTVHRTDAEKLIGAVNLDSFCTGTTMQDYLRARDLAHLPESATRAYEAGPPHPALLKTA